MADSAMDPSVASLLRRLDGPLPPLTSSNEVDDQLYAIFSLMISQFVDPWSKKLSMDHEFVDEAVQIIAHCTTALEERLRRMDLTEIMLDEVPALIENHLRAYRLASTKPHSSHVAADPHNVYHTLYPHPALSPIPHPNKDEDVRMQAENEAVWRQLLVQSVLAVLLPTEDLKNTALVSFVTELLAELFLKTFVANMACQGRILWAWAAIAAETQSSSIGADNGKTVKPSARKQVLKATRKSASARSQSQGLIIPKSERDPQFTVQVDQSQKSSPLWIWIHSFLSFVTLFRLTMASLTASVLNISAPPEQCGKPVLDMQVWSCVGTALQLQNRVPWITGLMALMYRLLIGDASKAKRGGSSAIGGIVDRFLRNVISRRASPTASHVCLALASLRRVLIGQLQNRSQQQPQQQEIERERKPKPLRPSSMLTAVGSPEFAAETLVASPPPLLPLPKTQASGGPRVAAPPDASPVSNRRRRDPLEAPSADALVRRRAAEALLQAIPPLIRGKLFIPRSDRNIHCPKIATTATTTGIASVSDEADVNANHSGEEEEDDDDDDDRAEERSGSAEVDEHEAMLQELARTLLDPFSDAYLNKHLAFALVELLVVRIMPETADKSVEQLMAERLG